MQKIKEFLSDMWEGLCEFLGGVGKLVVFVIAVICGFAALDFASDILSPSTFAASLVALAIIIGAMIVADAISKRN